MEEFSGKEPVQSEDESKQPPVTSSNAPRRGRIPWLTPEQKLENKRQCDRTYRKNKAAAKRTLVDENRALVEEKRELMEELSKTRVLSDKLATEVNDLKNSVNEAKMAEEKVGSVVDDLQPLFLNPEAGNMTLVEENMILVEENRALMEELSKTKELADKLLMEVSDLKKLVNKMKMVEDDVGSVVDDLQPYFLNPKEPLPKIPMDMKYLTSAENMDRVAYFDQVLNDLVPETVEFKDFKIQKDNAPAMHELFTKDPNIASGLRIKHEMIRSGYMDLLADTYKKVTNEVDKLTIEEIKHMKDDIKELENAGLRVSWLNDLVLGCWKRTMRREKEKTMNDELETVEEKQKKRKRKDKGLCNS